MQENKRTDACRDHPEPFVLAEAVLDVALISIVPWMDVFLAPETALLFNQLDGRKIRQKQITATRRW